MAVFSVSFPGGSPLMYVVADSHTEANQKVREHLRLYLFQFNIQEIVEDEFVTAMVSRESVDGFFFLS